MFTPTYTISHNLILYFLKDLFLSLVDSNGISQSRASPKCHRAAPCPSAANYYYLAGNSNLARRTERAMSGSEGGARRDPRRERLLAASSSRGQALKARVSTSSGNDRDLVCVLGRAQGEGPGPSTPSVPIYLGGGAQHLPALIPGGCVISLFLTARRLACRRGHRAHRIATPFSGRCPGLIPVVPKVLQQLLILFCF